MLRRTFLFRVTFVRSMVTGCEVEPEPSPEVAQVREQVGNHFRRGFAVLVSRGNARLAIIWR